MLALWIATALAAERPDAQALEAAWERWREPLQAHGRYPLTFSKQEWTRVAHGHVAKRRERLEGADRVVGMIWVDADPVTTWLSVQDPHGSGIEGMVHEELPGSTFQHRVLFQKIDLPWPMATRQWVIDVVNNQPLLEATDGAFWERTWTLSEQRGAKNEDPKAVWLPVNEGGWAYVDALGGTLVVYHVRSVVGGNIPDELATRWSFGTLTGMLERIGERLPWIRTHYDVSHTPIQQPDGTVVPPMGSDGTVVPPATPDGTVVPPVAP